VDLQKLQKQWDAWGKQDPMYVILVDENKKGGKWDREEFFRTGRHEIEHLLETVRSLEIPLRFGRALDFGCGLGRLSQALAPRFERVDGVDIAPSMVAQARDANQHPGRCHYHVNGADNLSLFPDASFDFIYSNIVLQHVEPQFAKRYVREFFRLLAPGGLAVFQIPSELSPDFLASRSRLRVRIGQLLAPVVSRMKEAGPEPPSIYMYPVPRKEVERIIGESGVQLEAALEDPSSGPEWTAYRYFVRKPVTSA
jgi:SAM-dependent methyltransferase